MKIDIEEMTKSANDEIASYAENLKAHTAALPIIAAAIESIAFDYCYFYPNTNSIICRVRTRNDFAPIRALRHGVWTKEVREDEGVMTTRYQGRIDAGTQITCYVCELPPSCRIEETPVRVEAHTRIDRKVICTEARELAAA